MVGVEVVSMGEELEEYMEEVWLELHKVVVELQDMSLDSHSGDSHMGLGMDTEVGDWD